MSTILDGIRREVAVYRIEEFPRLLHGVKAALAVVISMLICMRLELRTPGTAMVSAVIVMMHQQSGMVIARGFYRALGICCGSLAGLTLMCAFAQQPPFFLAGLSLWVGVFVAGSSYYKNFQSYGFVLSGYAACITTVPEWANPYDVTTNVIHTMSEVVIGVTTGSLISALVFPQKVAPALMKWRDSALSTLLRAMHSAAQGGALGAPIDNCLKLIRESVSIEELRTAAVFEEPEMRLRNEALIRIDRTFLDVVTRIHAVCRVRTFTFGVSRNGLTMIDLIFDKLVAVAAENDTKNREPEDALDRLHNRLRVLEAAFPDYVDSLLSTKPECSDSDARIVRMAGAEVYSAVSSLLDFCFACKTLFDPPRIQISQPVVKAIAFMRSAPIRSSSTAAIASGLRAAVAVGAVGVAWIASGWTNGYSAVVSAGITSGIYSLSSTPVTASWQAFAGCVLALVASFFLNFTLMPGVGDVTFLALSIGLVIFLGNYINTFPSIAVLGTGFCLYFCYMLSPTNVAVYNPPFFLDRGFALLIGIATSAVAYSLVIPHAGEWMARQYAAKIRRLLEHAANDSIDPEDTAQIATTMRDLIVRIATVPNVSKLYREKNTEWAFGSLWVANALVQLRELGSSDVRQLPNGWSDARGKWLDAMTKVARCPDRTITELALSATERALIALETRTDQPSPDVRRAMFLVCVPLYSTWLALNDQLSATSGARTVAS